MTSDGDTLFLQAKEARTSVLEPYAGKSIYPNQGQRIVNGYRLIQPFSDPFLGWTDWIRRAKLFYPSIAGYKNFGKSGNIRKK